VSVVKDFASQLRKRTWRAHWHKVDLHNHSPASHDFQGNRATAIEDYAAATRDNRLSVVMFTDHERLPDPSFVAELSSRTGALILPGLELNVFVDAFGKPADKVGKELCFHLLIGFDPESTPAPDYWVQHLYRAAGQERRDFGNHSMIGVTRNVTEIATILADSGAFLIPAHLHSGRDAYKSRSIDVIYNDSEFLRWARTCFAALDVRSDKTAAFFDGKHSETGDLEISCIRSSDAHSADQLGTFPTWVQMEHVSFVELKAALELPSRVSRNEPGSPTSYIVGLHIEGQFLRDFWLGFSPHSNVLVGVKGSGKTSVLECLRFGLGAEVPRERAAEVENHLAAVLGPAGRVRTLVRRDDGAHVLIERKIADRAFTVWFEDDGEVSIADAPALRFNASILGWHEIEHAATDRQIRRLYMDAIAGREDVDRITANATRDALSIRHVHDVAASKYSEFLQLADMVRQQEALREGLQRLQDANLIDLRDEMSNALADREELRRLSDHLASLPTQIASRAGRVLRVNGFNFNLNSPLKDVTALAASELSELRSAEDDFSARAKRLAEEKSESIAKLHDLGAKKYSDFAAQYQEKLNQFAPEVQRLLESHREVLEKTKELPTLRTRLSDLRNEVEEELRQLAETCRYVVAKLDERLTLRLDRVAAFNDLLKEASVVLTVVPGECRTDEFSATFTRFAPTKEIYGHIRAKHGTGRFHQALAECYEELRADLQSGDPVVFSRADFGHLITVLENDDLEIRFAVGKLGEPFSPIDQLSAGQRCTAVFPILLKLRGGPLVIDQPEDNLDNRHIAKSVAPVLIGDKRTRQIIMTSHNANLVVLSDPESIVVFESANGTGAVLEAGFLSHRSSKVTSHVLDILDGGDRALLMRSKKYGRLA
jgi:hypothetical protein